MATSIVISLDARRKDAIQFPIIFRLTHNGNTTSIAPGIRVKESEWDDKNRKIRASYKGTESPARLNNYLQKKKAVMTDILTRLEDRGELQFLSLRQVKDLLVRPNQKISFFEFTEKLISEMVEAKRIGNARVYRDTLNAVKHFCRNKDFTFYELNTNFLQRFENAHLSRGNKLGGLSVYLRTIRAINRKAIKAGVVEEEGYAFRNFKIRNGKPRKRAIPLDAIRKIKDVQLKEDTTLYRDRFIFLMSFYLRGMSFADLAHLKVSNIVDGRIQYDRKKTDQPFDVKIPDQLWPILKYLIKDKGKEDFILPVIKRDSPVQQYKDIEWARKRYNKNLKQIAELAGIEEKLTSYVSRHSYASIADEMGIPVTAISQMLGHEKVSTTQAYLDKLRKSKLDEYQDEVIKGL